MNFLPIIKEKVGIGLNELYQKTSFEIIKQEPLNVSWNLEILKLPYQFKDPIKIDRKIDPKTLRFGSKIDLSESNKETFFSVKDIISPEEMILNNDLKIKLLGVKTNKEVIEKAINFLKETLKGQKVFLKYDKIKYDSNGNLLVYLYLKNKTFINAHLIKKGLADLDNDLDFFYKHKFERIRGLNYG